MDTKEYHREYHKKWREENKERHREYCREYHQRNPFRSLSLETKKRRVATQRKYNERVKHTVLTYYGGGKPECIRCGFGDIRALSVDHIDGAGNTHRKRIQMNIYYWLKREGYPKGFQTLCMNCQFLKRVEDNELNRLY